MNQIYLMRFGMKNDTYFFLHIILYKNRAERARKTAWQTNENAQRIENQERKEGAKITLSTVPSPLLEIKQSLGHSGAMEQEQQELPEVFLKPCG